MQTRRKLTLPSGGTCTVTKLASEHFVRLGLDVPLLYGKIQNKTATDNEVAMFTAETLRVICLSCVSPIMGTDRRRRRIVEKDLDLLKPDEVLPSEIAEEDKVAIFEAVTGLTGMGEEASGQARTFPSEQKAGGDTGQNGEALQQASERDPQAVH